MKARLNDEFVSAAEYVKERTEPENLVGWLFAVGIIAVIAACMLTFGAPLYLTQFVAFSAVCFLGVAVLMFIAYCIAFKLLEYNYS